MFVVLMWNGCIILFAWIAADYHRRNKKQHHYLRELVKVNRTPQHEF